MRRPATSSGPTIRKCRVQWGRYACCDVVNRGVAVWKGARLCRHARRAPRQARREDRQADLGQSTRSTATAPYTITGAPRIVKGMVLIGNGGAEYGVRGYLTAYDADTGHQIWRFYVVPGDPQAPPEDKAMADAMKTWSDGGTQHKWWEHRRRRHAVEFDGLRSRSRSRSISAPATAHPWNRNLRSPDGGDNLYLSSIVALKPATGELVWYYQTTPGDDLGLHRDPAHHARRLDDRRVAAQGADAGAEERLLLCDRPHRPES